MLNGNSERIDSRECVLNETKLILPQVVDLCVHNDILFITNINFINTKIELTWFQLKSYNPINYLKFKGLILLQSAVK